LSPQRQILKGDGMLTATEQEQNPKQIQEDGRHGLDYFPTPTTSTDSDRILAKDRRFSVND
jgi:hypothetical protein